MFWANIFALAATGICDTTMSKKDHALPSVKQFKALLQMFRLSWDDRAATSPSDRRYFISIRCLDGGSLGHQSDDGSFLWELSQLGYENQSWTVILLVMQEGKGIKGLSGPGWFIFSRSEMLCRRLHDYPAAKSNSIPGCFCQIRSSFQLSISVTSYPVYALRVVRVAGAYPSCLRLSSHCRS